MPGAATVHPFPPRQAVSPTLQRGSSGPAVAELQAKLNLLGYGPVSLSQQFDEATEAALRSFQQRESLQGSGQLDPASEVRLNQRVLSVSGSQQRQQPKPARPGVSGARTGLRDTPDPAARPLWQTGLMVLGGISLVGGALYLLTKDDEDDGEGYRRGLPSRTVEHSRGTDVRYQVPTERARRVGAAEPGGDDREKCARTPSVDDAQKGTVLSS